MADNSGFFPQVHLVEMLNLFEWMNQHFARLDIYKHILWPNIYDLFVELI